MSHMKQKLLEQKHLGVAIKQVLAEVDMTQIALADRSGIPRNTLNRKINVGIFNFDELRRIAWRRESSAVLDCCFGRAA